MKARLGVDHWVKCIGLHVRASLREMSRKFPHSSLKRDDLMEHWSIPGLMGGAPLPTQIQIVCVHAFWSKYFEKVRFLTFLQHFLEMYYILTPAQKNRDH